ncbi:lysophospholipase L1-like esterase [Rhizobium sp. BK316]|uniref:SGNH/GDSL hydrolase family protein n=1 Tax=Rhizobium sp. BK316 TaxID=2587053 RepID=UPI00160B7B1B|nr:SGNH/GDSL hydrolase family protein [Rhizobium sp. BK316]MBB3411184.1 lysophospholipase L1-like esterase [Rhizobium sp. BK316]
MVGIDTKLTSLRGPNTAISSLGPQGFALARGGGVNNMAKYKAARAAVLAGTRFGRALNIGDSTTAGFGALTNGTLDGAFPLSYPADLAAYLTSHGLPARSCSMGDGNSASLSAYTAYDTRNSFGSGVGWAIQTASSIGAGLIRAGSTTVDRWVKTFSGTWDTIEIVYINIAAGNCSVFIDGGAVAVGSFSPTAGGGVTGTPQRATITVPRGAHTSVEILRNSGTNIYVSSVEVYDSQNKEFLIYNCGWASAKSTDLVVTTANYRTLNMIQFMQPDLMILNIGINDYPTTPQATFEANVTTLVNTARLSGDVVLNVPNPRSATANQAAFRGYIQGLAVTLNTPLVDLQLAPPAGLGDYATASANGDINVDGIHPTAQGYNKMANFNAQPMLTA